MKVENHYEVPMTAWSPSNPFDTQHHPTKLEVSWMTDYNNINWNTKSNIVWLLNKKQLSFGKYCKSLSSTNYNNCHTQDCTEGSSTESQSFVLYQKQESRSIPNTVNS